MRFRHQQWSGPEGRRPELLIERIVFTADRITARWRFALTCELLVTFLKTIPGLASRLAVPVRLWW